MSPAIASTRFAFHPAALLLTIGAAWTGLVVAAPLLAWPSLYTATHLVCHQLPERTFFVAGGPMAVCARCFGLYVGGVAGGAVALLASRPPHVPGQTARVAVLTAAVPTILTLLAEWMMRWPVGNAVRFAAALPLGAAAAWVVARALEVDWRA